MNLTTPHDSLQKIYDNYGYTMDDENDAIYAHDAVGFYIYDTIHIFTTGIQV